VQGSIPWGHAIRKDFMKIIDELSKEELKGAFMHQFPDVPFKDKLFACAICGETPNALFYYLCDECTRE